MSMLKEEKKKNKGQTFWALAKCIMGQDFQTQCLLKSLDTSNSSENVCWNTTKKTFFLNIHDFPTQKTKHNFYILSQSNDTEINENVLKHVPIS